MFQSRFNIQKTALLSSSYILIEHRIKAAAFMSLIVSATAISRSPTPLSLCFFTEPLPLLVTYIHQQPA